jgi:hypothetical protein
MAVEGLLVEIHPKSCGCRGASWMVTKERAGTYCPSSAGQVPEGAVLVPHDEWRTLGRPKSPEAYRTAQDRLRR